MNKTEQTILDAVINTKTFDQQLRAKIGSDKGLRDTAIPNAIKLANAREFSAINPIARASFAHCLGLAMSPIPKSRSRCSVVTISSSEFLQPVKDTAPFDIDLMASKMLETLRKRDCLLIAQPVVYSSIPKKPGCWIGFRAQVIFPNPDHDDCGAVRSAAFDRFGGLTNLTRVCEITENIGFESIRELVLSFLAYPSNTLLVEPEINQYRTPRRKFGVQPKPPKKPKSRPVNNHELQSLAMAMAPLKLTELVRGFGAQEEVVACIGKIAEALIAVYRNESQAGLPSFYGPLADPTPSRTYFFA
jgi:hypothetical protein